MPQRLLTTDSVELNYVAARGEGRLYLAFANQTRSEVTAEVSFSREVCPEAFAGPFRVKVLADGAAADDVELRNGRFPVRVRAEGQTAVVIEGLKVTPRFQQKLIEAKADQAWSQDYVESNVGQTRAMILNFGPAAKTAYIYLQADDAVFKEVRLHLMEEGRRTATLTDRAYPFEFTVPVSDATRRFEFQVEGLSPAGASSSSETLRLAR